MYFLLIIAPCWAIARKAHKDAGAWLFPTVRPGIDHAGMAPKLLAHLHRNNYENAPDRLGRRSADFYRNIIRQDMSHEMKPTLIRKFNKHGFNY